MGSVRSQYELKYLVGIIVGGTPGLSIIYLIEQLSYGLLFIVVWETFCKTQWKRFSEFADKLYTRFP